MSEYVHGINETSSFKQEQEKGSEANKQNTDSVCIVTLSCIFAQGHDGRGNKPAQATFLHTVNCVPVYQLQCHTIQYNCQFNSSLVNVQLLTLVEDFFQSDFMLH